MKSVLRFDPAGQVACLYTEAIDLRELGRLRVSRATDIRFNPDTQQWEVHQPEGGILHTHPSRGECLRWESENLQSGPTH